MSANQMELIVAVSGTITKSNFDDFKAMAEERIKSLNFEPVTDEEFGQAEADVKGLAKFEKDLSTAEQDVLKQMDEVYQLVSGIGELKKLSAESRLKLKKQIDSQKKVVRSQIKRAALSTIPLAHPQAEARIEAAMKGKRTLDSLRAAADAEAERSLPKLSGSGSSSTTTGPITRTSCTTSTSCWSWIARLPRQSSHAGLSAKRPCSGRLN